MANRENFVIHVGHSVATPDSVNGRFCCITSNQIANHKTHQESIAEYKNNREQWATPNMRNYDRSNELPSKQIKDQRAHIIGGGIAGLSAAAFLVTDAARPAHVGRGRDEDATTFVHS